MTMRYAEIPLDRLFATEAGRAVDERVVTALADSIMANGLLQPILVQEAKTMRGGICVPGFRIIAGNHRVAAARQVGHVVIQARVLDETTGHMEAELIEIDENLCRAELTPAQRAQAIQRRKQIWEALHPEGGAICATPGGQQVVGFAADTAKVSGEPKASINRHLSRAEALGDDLQAVAGTSLDKGVELDALKSLPPPERKQLIERARAGEKVSARRTATRISLTIEYDDAQDGAFSLAHTIIARDRALALALLSELKTQLSEAA